jgi:sugar-phosphatase
MIDKSSIRQSIHVRGVLFDMDGVLINSTAADERSWLRWAQTHGMEGTFSVQSTHGRRTIDTIRLLRPDLDHQTELNRIEDFDAEETDGIVLLSGVTSLIASLPPNSWTVVTSASDRLMRLRLQSAGLTLPPRVVSADSVVNGKPHPEPYLLGAELLHLFPSECLVIEDSPTGIRAGKAAGCAVLGVAGTHRTDELEDADWIVPSLCHIGASPGENGEITIHLYA